MGIMNLSGFTFVHNALDGGYPIVEAIDAVRDYVSEIVVVDMQSDDGTRELLEKLDVRIIDGEWGNQAGVTLAKAHYLHTECKEDLILHFEADEIYEPNLVNHISRLVLDYQNIAVYRLQLEQNFQRCRWYPELVHRVFPKGEPIKLGHTTNKHHLAESVATHIGFLWDVTNCFRLTWKKRIWKQAELWDETVDYRAVPIHAFSGKVHLTTNEANGLLKQPHWNWTTTPFKIPESLKKWVGVPQYNPELAYDFRRR